MPSTSPRLKVSHLGPIQSADIAFGDLTVLVGPQASGKSVLLQTLKLVLDHRSIAERLEREGYEWGGDPANFARLFYGEGMDGLWTDKTRVTWRGRVISLRGLAATKIGNAGVDSLFYAPAHRVMTLKNGWPRHFGDYSPGDPYVVRDFSERLRKFIDMFLGKSSGDLWFADVFLAPGTRLLLQPSIYGDFRLKQELNGLQKRLVLQRGSEKSLPFMVWSAGQREFTPLLLGCSDVIESSLGQRKALDWVVLEEPEMGLHPRAITAVLFLVLELLHLGYRVCISTHSPHVLDLLWALRVFIEKGAKPEWVLKLFDVETQAENMALAASILAKSIKVYYLDREESKAVEISRLDAESASPHETNWGGLTEFSARASDIVAEFVANQP